MKRALLLGLLAALAIVAVVALRRGGAEGPNASVVDTRDASSDQATSARDSFRAVPEKPRLEIRSPQPPPPHAVETSARDEQEDLMSAQLPFVDDDQVSPLDAVAITKSEWRQMLRLVDEGMERQRALDRREQSGEISLEEHDQLSDELVEEMNGRMAAVLGAERSQIFVDMAQQWAKRALPRVIEKATHQADPADAGPR